MSNILHHASHCSTKQNIVLLRLPLAPSYYNRREGRTLYIVMTMKSSVCRGGSYNRCLRVYMSSTKSFGSQVTAVYLSLVNSFPWRIGHCSSSIVGTSISSTRWPWKSLRTVSWANARGIPNSLDAFLRPISPDDPRWNGSIVHIDLVLTARTYAVTSSKPILPFSITVPRVHRDAHISSTCIAQLISYGRSCHGHCAC